MERGIRVIQLLSHKVHDLLDDEMECMKRGMTEQAITILRERLQLEETLQQIIERFHEV